LVTAALLLLAVVVSVVGLQSVKDQRAAAGVGLEMGLPVNKTFRADLRLGYLFGRDNDSFTVGVGFK
jgi:hypothetical protein